MLDELDAKIGTFEKPRDRKYPTFRCRIGIGFFEARGGSTTSKSFWNIKGTSTLCQGFNISKPASAHRSILPAVVIYNEVMGVESCVQRLRGKSMVRRGDMVVQNLAINNLIDSISAEAIPESNKASTTKLMEIPAAKIVFGKSIVMVVRSRSFRIIDLTAGDLFFRSTF